MKPKNANYKLLYQNIKKRRDIQKNPSHKSSSQLNDDSLDKLDHPTPQRKLTHIKNQQEISQQDLKQLRTCISNQFKKSNFIHFSAIKHKSNYAFFEPEIKPHQISQTQPKNLAAPQIESKTHINKRNILASHNRSQSCPFIQPLYSHDNLSMKERRANDPGIVFSSIKVQNSQKKKISMQYLTKNRNKFLNTTGNTQNKVFNHNYSNSLTQSSNTVIVHNIPNENVTSIVQNENLSSILYKKVEQEESIKTQKQRIKQQKVQNVGYLKVNEQKKSGISQKTLQKKSLANMSILKQDFYIKTRINQRMRRYEIRQQKQRLQMDTKRIEIKDMILQKLLMPYGNQVFEQVHDSSLHSIKQSMVMDNRSVH